MWPSGKATLFGSVYRRFESYHPSQTLPNFWCHRVLSALSARYPRLAYVGLYVRRDLETNIDHYMAFVSLRHFHGTSLGLALQF